MKRHFYSLTLTAFCTLVLSICAHANGVAVVDATYGTWLTLDSTASTVVVRDQVATVTTRQTWHNQLLSAVSIAYAYPLPSGASAISLRWFMDGEWGQAVVTGRPQDSTLPGSTNGSVSPTLTKYLGQSPLLLTIPSSIPKGSTITIELTYVQLLPYELGAVSFSVPNDYRLIQSTRIPFQSFHFALESQRDIDSIALTSQTATSLTVAQRTAKLEWQADSDFAMSDYHVSYWLNSSSLGLFGYSTYQDSAVDGKQRGYMLFIAEPDAREESASIPKTFVLVIDRSGSMGSENKMGQARDAASFIVNHLNGGDYFNIVDFDDKISTMASQPVEYTASSIVQAQSYINTLTSRNSTDIASALTTAAAQFPAADTTNPNDRANIILFFTDGQPTAGITSLDGILNAVATAANGKNLTIFPFGVGSDVNKQLLAQLALKNNGIAEFLTDTELSSRITKFYLKVRNPVLLQPSVTFDPSIIADLHPKILPNLYKGVQMLVTGRYEEPAHPLHITLSGYAFGKKRSYSYDLDLAGGLDTNSQFLPKIWAKLTIEDLLVQYYTFDEYSDTAKALKDSIISLSVKYGIVTEFTSFRANQGGGAEVHSSDEYKGISVAAYPNPFVATTRIVLTYSGAVAPNAITIKVYSMAGQIVRTLTAGSATGGRYTIEWDGLDETGAAVASGAYVVVLSIGDRVIATKVERL